MPTLFSLFRDMPLHGRALPVAVLMALITLPAVVSADAQAWTVESLVRKSASDHPSVRAKFADLESAEQEARAARWQRFPTVSASSQRLNGQQLTLLSLQQPLWTGGKLTEGEALAQSRTASAAAAAKEAQWEVAQRVVGAWLSAASAQARERVSADALFRLDELRGVVERRVAAGLSPSVEMDLLITRFKQALADRSQARSDSRSALTTLSALTGTVLSEVPPVLQPSTELAARNDDDAVSKAVATSAALSRLQAEIQAAEHAAAVADAAVMPNVSLRAERQFGRMAGSLEPGARFAVTLEHTLGAGLGQAARSSAASARAKKEAALLAREAAVRDVESRVVADLNALRLLGEQRSVYQAVLDAADAVVLSYQRLFVAGRRSWQDLLNAVRELSDAQRALWLCEVQTHAAELRVRLDIGELP